MPEGAGSTEHLLLRSGPAKEATTGLHAVCEARQHVQFAHGSPVTKSQSGCFMAQSELGLPRRRSEGAVPPTTLVFASVRQNDRFCGQLDVQNHR